MIGWTMCSGIGAPEVAAPWVDWRLASEIEAFPRSVLQERFGYALPADHNQGDPILCGDFTEITPEFARSRGVPLPDILVAGTPCQAFSLAGMRKGTGDARGNLTLKFLETCHAIVDARPDGRLAVLWENVPGVLSDKGNAFGCFLGGLVGAVDPLRPPGDGSWPGEGMVSGPRARAAWSVLDAQWFGVAQRRRRVFVVVDFGGCIDPAKILLEPDSLRGDRPSRRSTGQGSAPGAAQGVALRGREGGGTAELTGEVATALRASQGGSDKPHVIASTGEISHCLNAGGQSRLDLESETMIAHSPRAFRTPGNSGAYETGERVDALTTGSDQTASVLAYAIQERAVSANPDAGPDGAGFRGDDAAFTLEARTTAQSVARASDVRRLMPVECERLQGFPDFHTDVSHRGKPASDGPRYKGIGNSMAVPVIAWLMDRIRASVIEERG